MLTSGNDIASLLRNLTPQDSTNLRGGLAPSRAMMRSHAIVPSPVGPLSAMRPASMRTGSALYSHFRAPDSIAWRIWLRLPVLARENSPRRLTMTTRFCRASAIAFSIAASPAPMTTMDSSLYSPGSSS